MITFSATMWPHGSAAGSYELLNGTISNRTSHGDEGESYMCHVTARPKPFGGIIGYDADVEVTRHRAQTGFTPLLLAALGAAYAPDDESGLSLPPARALARVELVDVHQFEALLRGKAK